MCYGMIRGFTVFEKRNRLFQLLLEIVITNYMSVCIVQNVYRKKLNKVCNQTLKFFLQIHDTEAVFGRMNIRGLYYIRPAIS